MTAEQIEALVGQFRDLISRERADVSIQFERPAVEVDPVDMFRRFEQGPDLYVTIRVKVPIEVANVS